MVFSCNKNCKKTFNSPLLEIYKKQAKELVKKLTEENLKLINRPKMLVLHSGLFKTSNTLMLWKMLKENLNGKDIGEKLYFPLLFPEIQGVIVWLNS